MPKISTDLQNDLCALLKGTADALASRTAAVHAKGPDGLDFVTSVDLAIQARLTEALPRLFPGSRVVGEEGFAGLGAVTDPVWLVDPLDGTVNFVAGLPCYATAAVLIEDGRPVLAAVHDIPQGTTYAAHAGGGAFCNGAAIAPPAHAAKLAILSSGLLRDLAAHAPDRLGTFLGRFKLRNFGSQALHLCHAAAGHVSLVASREAKGWDDLAGALIAQEAGLRYGSYGKTTREIGEDQYSLCAAADIFDIYAAELACSIT